MQPQDIDNADILLLARLIQLHRGHEFHEYAIPSLKRRIARFLELRKLTVDELLDRAPREHQLLDDLIASLTVTVTEMFRDPGLWVALRDEVIPSLVRSGETLRIWQAGVASGEEVYSMAILLRELGIKNSYIWATDLDAHATRRARTGMFSMQHLSTADQNYRQVGNRPHLTAWLTEWHGYAVVRPTLFNHVEIERHDLVTGPVHGTFDLVLCRNVMIYFNQTLQEKVLAKIHRHLTKGGVVSVGAKESLAWCETVRKFQQLGPNGKMYRKVTE